MLIPSALLPSAQGKCKYFTVTQITVGPPGEGEAGTGQCRVPRPPSRPLFLPSHLVAGDSPPVTLRVAR